MDQMDRYYGFDLGDAESCIARLDRDGASPDILTVGDAKSFITAYALLQNGELLIGENACYAANAQIREVRFKSRYLTDAASKKKVRRFAGGVLGKLYESGDLVKDEDCCFYIGCPAGWDAVSREEYRAIFEDAGFPPLRILSESRAALVSACRSKHLQVGYDILSRPVLVIDIGSSTTDFAFIENGKEVALKTAGEVVLGGGLMDEALLAHAIDNSSRSEKIRKFFADNAAWKNYCDFAARHLKEKYFTDEDYWSSHSCTESVMLPSGALPLRLRLSIDPTEAASLTEGPLPSLSGRSFHEVFSESLRDVREKLGSSLPELIFLTGGVAKMPVMRSYVQEIFPEAVVITASEPAFSVAKGLAYCGKVDDDLRAFKAELSELVRSSVVEEIVRSHISDLYRETVNVLVEPVLRHTALPVFDRWKSGEIRKLSEIDGILADEIRDYLLTDEAKQLLIGPIAKWLNPVSADLEEHTMPICAKYSIPYRSLSLTSYLSISDLEIRIDTKNIFAVEEITWMIDALISVVVGLLCGGSGIALISGGAPGIIAGAFFSLVLLVLGQGPMEKALLNVDIPNALRKLVRRSSFESRMDNMKDEICANFYKSLEEEKNEEISVRMIDDISTQIEQCLTKMAEVVEIPFG